jgi:hypothetical protein
MMKNSILILCIAAFLSGCQKESSFQQGQARIIAPTNKNRELLRQRFEQRAAITASVMADPEISKSFARAVKAKLKWGRGNADEAISFEEIVQGIQPYLKEFAPAFTQRFTQVYQSGKYIRSGQYSPSTTNANTRSGISELLANHDNCQIYFPYSSCFTEAQLANPAVSYYPMADVITNTGFKSQPESDSTYALIVDEEYAKRQPLYIINDNLDANYAADLESIDAIDSLPQPPGYICNFLNYNTVSDSVHDGYTVSVTMPHYRMIDNIRTVFGGSNKITLKQYFAKPLNLNPNPSPALQPFDTSGRYIFIEKKILREEVGTWILGGQIVNDFWSVIQYENPLILYGKLGWFSDPTGSINASVGGGVRLDTLRNGAGVITGYQWVPSFNLGGTFNFTATIDDPWTILGTDYVTRRGLLANAVGDNFGLGTAQQQQSVYWQYNWFTGWVVPQIQNIQLDPNPYAVRQISDMFQYYLKIRICR